MNSGTMDHSFALRLFVKVVEEGSFSKAGPLLGVTQSSASRTISALEQSLKTQLIQRSTRKLNLTEAGRIYFDRACRIIEDINEANLAVKRLNATPVGLLRVTAPASFGRLHLAPLLAPFHDLCSEVEIGLSLSEDIQDIVGAGFDLAIRFGTLSDSGLIVKHLATSRSVICAHPAYLEQAGTPQIPNDLIDHNCLLFRTTPGRNIWHFERAGKTYSIAATGSLFADTGDALLAAALSGLGMVHLPVWMVAPDIAAGQLVSVLQDYTLLPNTTPIQAVFAHNRYPTPKARAFIDFLKAQYGMQDW